MKITILSENKPKEGWLTEHGLSMYIETEEHSILFDTGASDHFLHNAKKCNIDLKTATKILSHGHWDHGNGLEHISGGTLIGHKDIFLARYRNRDDSYIGLKLDRRALEERFNLKLTRSPLWINNQTVFLGEIPRHCPFESQTTSFHLKEGTADFVPDDSAIVIKGKEGIHIITGCNHSGLNNLMDYAIEVTKDDRILSIIGGLHLKETNNDLDRTIERIKKYPNIILAPMHCTSQIVIEKLKESCNVIELYTGDSWEK